MSTHQFPQRKISETLIDFAKPLLAIVEDPISPEQLRQVFMIAVCVWDSEVLDAARGGDTYRQLLSEHLRRGKFDQTLIEALIDRKRRFFADDMRAIGDFKIRVVEGELRLWAEARDPYQDRST